MSMFCHNGIFHNYQYYIGPDPIHKGLEIEYWRCKKCGKVKGSDEYISDIFIETERLKWETYITRFKTDLIKKGLDPVEVDDLLGDDY